MIYRWRNTLEERPWGQSRWGRSGLVTSVLRVCELVVFEDMGKGCAQLVHVCMIRDIAGLWVEY